MVMPKFQVIVTSTSTATIECEDKETAEEIAIEFIGDDGDLSTPEDRQARQFSISNVDAQSVEVIVWSETEDEDAGEEDDEKVEKTPENLIVTTTNGIVTINQPRGAPCNQNPSNTSANSRPSS